MMSPEEADGKAGKRGGALTQEHWEEVFCFPFSIWNQLNAQEP